MSMNKQGNNKPVFNLGLISEYRDELFGIAIIAIVIFHYCADFNGAIDVIKEKIYTEPFLLKTCILKDYFKWISSVGVEIFVFLSGMGLYFSFKKNNNLAQFYKKRYLRILPAYIIVASVFWAIKDFKFKGLGIRGYFHDITFYSFFTDGVHTIWFILLMLVLYAVFPVIFKLLDKNNRNIWFVLMLILTYGFPIILCYVDNTCYNNISIAITRIPLFVIGCYFGKHIKQGYEIAYSKVFTFVIVALFLKYCRVYLDLNSYTDRYFDGIYSLGLIIIITCVVMFFGKSAKINSVWRFFGKYSLEIYIIHVTMRNLMKEFGFDAYRISQYFTMIFIAVILSVLLNKLCGKITHRMQN